MNCPYHPKNAVVGYCSSCGSLGCKECVVSYDDRILCQRCYRREARDREATRKSEGKPKRTVSERKQKLVIRFASGKILKGTSYNLDLNGAGFYLNPKESSREDERLFIRYADIKAVFFVRNFEGLPEDAELEDAAEWYPEGSEILVEFPDGEVIEGFSLTQYREEAPRFHLIPTDQNTNNISILVERSNTASVRAKETLGAVSPDSGEAKPEEKAEKDLQAELTQEETLGDLYLDTRDFSEALENFQRASKKIGQIRRLKKKIALCHYNLGMTMIKRHDYVRALDHMGDVLKLFPKHPKAQKKYLQLKKALKESEETEPAEAE